MSSMSYIDEGNNCATIVRLIAATAFAQATTTPRPTQPCRSCPIRLSSHLSWDLQYLVAHSSTVSGRSDMMC